MFPIVAGLAGIGIVLLLAALTYARLRSTYRLDSVWARLWTRSPWLAERISAPHGAPEPLKRYVGWVAPDAATTETVAEVRFQVSAPLLRDMLPAGRYLAVLAMPEGAMLRWRASAGRMPVSGVACLDAGRWVRNEWLFGLVSSRRGRQADAAAEAVDGAAAAMLLAACWAPASLIRDGKARWTLEGDMTLSTQLIEVPGQPAVAIRLMPDGQPAEISVSAQRGTDRVELRATLSDFELFDGYRLPRRLSVTDAAPGANPSIVTLQSVRFPGPWANRFSVETQAHA
ncbi:MAG: hypothetical protein WBA44_04190 [Mesorhizobium sp.]